MWSKFSVFKLHPHYTWVVFPTPIKNGSFFAEPLGLSRLMCLPGKTRTSDLMVRSHALYPTGLRADMRDCCPVGIASYHRHRRRLGVCKQLQQDRKMARRSLLPSVLARGNSGSMSLALLSVETLMTASPVQDAAFDARFGLHIRIV